MNMSRSYATGFYLHHQFDFVEGTRHDIQTLKPDVAPAVSKPDIFRSVQSECMLNYSTTHQVRTLLDEHGNSQAQRLVCQKKHRLLQKRNLYGNSFPQA